MMPGSAIDDPSHHTTRAEVATLGTRVGQLEKGMNDIAGKLDGLVGLISSRGQTNWGHIISAGSLMCAILGLVGGALYLPILTGQAKNEIAVASLATKTEGTFEKVLGRMEAREERTHNMLVPRQEIELWREQTRWQMERIVKRLDRIEFKGEKPGS